MQGEGGVPQFQLAVLPELDINKFSGEGILAVYSVGAVLVPYQK